MSDPYLGEIRMFAGNFAPAGWAFCDGATMAISENDTLFNLIGTTYGGDGQTTFNLPNLQSRVPVHYGTGPALSTYGLGEVGGVESVTLTSQQMPVHNHPFVATTDPGTASNAQGRLVAASPSDSLYIQDSPSVTMAAQSLGPSGGSQPHSNLMPHIAINYIISLFGIYPSQT
jgi:microcystin-dependent protein